MVPAKPPRNSPASRPIAALPSSAEAPVIAFSGDGCLLAHWRGVMIGVWAMRTTLEWVGEIEKLLDAMSETHPKFSSVQLITSSFALPAADVRARLGALTLRHGDRLACGATLLAGTGFWASAIRGVVTSIQVLDLRRRRQRVFGSVEELAGWLAPVHNEATGGSIDSAELRHVLQRLLEQPSVRDRAPT